MDNMHSRALPQGLPQKPALWSRDFVFITLINLLLFLGFQFYPSALPPYVKSLGAPDSALGWLTGIATVSTLMTRPLAGLLLDKLGRRGVFISGLVIMTCVSGSLYFFPALGLILGLRFIHGLGWGVASTSASTIAADYIPKARFGEGMGYFNLSASLAMAVSPAIALSLPPGPMFFLATGFMAAAALLAFFLRYKPLEDGGRQKIRRNPYEKAAALPALVMGLVSMCFGANVTFLAVYAAERGIGNIGPFFTVYAVAMMITRPKVGKIVDRRGVKVTIPPGLTLIAATFIILSQAETLPVFLGAAALYGVGQGTLFSSTQTMAVLAAPPGRVGAANATFFTGFDAGLGLGAVGAGLLAKTLGYSATYLCLAVCPCLAALLFALYLRRS